MQVFIDRFGPLSPEKEHQLERHFEAELGRQMPLIAPIFGVTLLLMIAWDYFVDPTHAAQTAAIRIGLVILGATAYWRTPLHWSIRTRRAVIYFTHTFGAIIPAYVLQDGLVLQVAGITTTVFPLSIVAIRLREVIVLAMPPFALLAVLAFIGLPAIEFANLMFVYALALGVTCALTQSNRISRKAAFLLERKLTDLAHHDSLTGLNNRGYLTELAEQEVARSRRYGHPLSIAMLDIDRFKTVNDTYGHDIGDMVIKALAGACNTTMRGTDHVGRVGGEEFVWIMPETPIGDAANCAERLRRHIEQIRVATPKGEISFTVSIGVVELPPHADWPILLKAADSAMYQAKQAGRNRVVVGPAVPEDPASAETCAA
ncbi:MAG TPA: GGDEF domain-containing protein [Noviherbaspirillum sp.]